ncbi:MAG: hypothetical protein KDA28_03295, partial [Phycisphaerales bacterium]|nr:hypothetical protein [Phycisphaerales bacterium]
MHIPRRTFLAHAGLAMAAPMILPRAAARTVANEQITLGIIGMGIRARNIMNGSLFKDEGCRILARIP